MSELRQSWATLTSVDHTLVRTVVGGAFAVCPNSWAELDHLATYLQVTPDERWVVVRNGIWPNEVPDDLPWEARTPEVLCLGALSPRKNSLTLVRAARRAGLRLRIVGQEPDKLDGYGRRVMAACGEHTTVEAPRSRGEVLLAWGDPSPRADWVCRDSWLGHPGSNRSWCIRRCRFRSSCFGVPSGRCLACRSRICGVGGGGAGGGHWSSP